MLSTEQCQRLTSSGIVHVTGLILKEAGLPKLPVIAHPDEYGSWDRSIESSRHPRFLLITTEGEVWIACSHLNAITSDILDEFCPNGRCGKAWWPTFWALNTSDILRRIREPYWEYEPKVPTDEEVRIYCQRQISVRS